MLDEDIQKELDKVHVAIDNVRFMKIKYADILPEDAFNSEISRLEELRNKYSEMIYPSC